MELSDVTQVRRPAVCIVRHNYYPDTHVRRDAEALADAGYDVSVVALRKANQASRERLNGVDVHRLPVQHVRGSALRYAWEYASFTALAFLTVTWLHLRNRFRVVEVDNMPDILVFSALVPKLFGARVILYIFDNMPELFIVTRKCSPRHPMVRLLAAIEKVSCAFADQVVVTQKLACDLVVSRGVPTQKVEVILNAPDEKVFSAQIAASRTPSSENFVIVTHGAIIERYGIQILLDAVPRVAAEVPEVRVEIFGEGEYRRELERRARENGILDRVVFHGYTTMEELLAGLSRANLGYAGMLCDLMLSNKLVEYVALGIPAVAARWPTFEHYFPEGSVKYFEPGDVENLSEAIVASYRDPEAAQARAARASALYQNYRWDVQREAYLAVYESLLIQNTGLETRGLSNTPA